MRKTIRSRRTIAVIVLSAILLLMMIVGTTISYLVRKITADNLFSVATVELTVKEDDYPENEQSRFVVPKSFMPKNPRLVNTGSTSLYAFAKVTVPYEDVVLISDHGENINMPDPSGKKERELFNLFSNDTNCFSGTETEDFFSGFTVADTGDFTYGHNWIFISSEEDTVNKTHSYLFGYHSVLTPENGHNTTDTIFDKIQLRNVLEGLYGDSVTKKITVEAYGLQSEELKGSIAIADPTDLTKPEIISLYTIYRNQEG